jgi:hypothetical protein
MRKQIDFDVRVFPLGNGANGSMTREEVSDFIRTNYLDSQTGWEVFNVNANQVAAGVIYYQVTLCKYEDVNLVAKAASAK